MQFLPLQSFRQQFLTAQAEREELEWHEHLAVVLGAGEWAADWAARHQRTQVANDATLAQALSSE